MIEGKPEIGIANPLCTREIAAWEQIAANLEAKQSVRLPIGALRKTASNLFVRYLPQTGDTILLQVPYPFIVAGIEAAWRGANAIHKKKSALGAGEVLRRLGIEIGRCMAALNIEDPS